GHHGAAGRVPGSGAGRVDHRHGGRFPARSAAVPVAGRPGHRRAGGTRRATPRRTGKTACPVARRRRARRRPRRRCRRRRPPHGPRRPPWPGRGAVVTAVDREWVTEAVRAIDADANRSADTHLLVFPLPEDWGIDLYLKDESVHPTGSLKHRLARSLFLYGLVNGQIGPSTVLVEASSGSTAVSEAYFARMLGLDFVTVVPRSTSKQKIELIEFYGGRCHFVDRPPEMYPEAERLAAECGGYYLDQFTYAERATDWPGNNYIAESILNQLRAERHPIPRWIVVGAGTGGTSATLGRYVRYRRHPTQIAVVDPENSSFYWAWKTGATDYTTGMPSRI